MTERTRWLSHICSCGTTLNSSTTNSSFVLPEELAHPDASYGVTTLLYLLRLWRVEDLSADDLRDALLHPGCALGEESVLGPNSPPQRLLPKSEELVGNPSLSFVWCHPRRRTLEPP